MASQNGEALMEMKETIRIEGDEAYYREEKLSFSQSMDSEFQNVRPNYVHRLKKNIKGRFKKVLCLVT